MPSTFTKETTAETVASTFEKEITGKTILVTGVSPNSLGEALVHSLAPHRPGRLLLTARSVLRLIPIADSVKSKFPHIDVYLIHLDLASFPTVHHAATQAINHLGKHGKVDILFNNAGVMGLPTRTLAPKTGVEMHLATNWLGPFLFSNLLLRANMIREGSRVVNVTSAGAVLQPFRFSDYNWAGGKELPDSERTNMEVATAMGMRELQPDGSGGYVPLLAYSQTSTAIMLFTKGLVDKGKGIEAFSAAPGVVQTGLQRHMPADFHNPNMFYKTPSQGVASFLVAALDPQLSEHPGSFIDDCNIVPTPPAHATDKESADKLWKLGEELTGEQF